MWMFLNPLPVMRRNPDPRARMGALRRRDRRARPGAEALEGRALLAAPYYGYALDLGGTAQALGSGVAADAAGDAVATGSFTGTTDFDPENPSDTAAILTTPSYYDSNNVLHYTPNAYVARYDPAGNLLWAHAFGAGTQGALGERVAIDPAGDIYAAGELYGSAVVGADAAGRPYVVTAPDTGGVYLVKYTPDGVVQWAEATTSDNFVRNLAVDAAGDAYLTVGFRGVRYLGDPNTVLTKFGPDGSPLWSETSVASYSGMTFDAAGDLFVTGGFQGTVDFDPGPGTYSLSSGGRSSSPSTSAFVEELTPSGQFVWADAFKASAFSHSGGASVAVDASGNVLVAGTYSGTVDYDPASKTKYTLATSGNDATFVEKLTPTGQFSWAKSIGGSGSAEATAMVLDGSGNIDLLGVYSGTVDFDPGAGAYNLTSPTYPTAYVAQLTGSGTFAWATGQVRDRPTALAVDGAGDLFIIGNLATAANFDPNGSEVLTPQGSTDAFLWKLKPTQ